MTSSVCSSSSSSVFIHFYSLHLLLHLLKSVRVRLWVVSVRCSRRLTALSLKSFCLSNKSGDLTKGLSEIAESAMKKGSPVRAISGSLFSAWLRKISFVECKTEFIIFSHTSSTTHYRMTTFENSHIHFSITQSTYIQFAHFLFFFNLEPRLAYSFPHHVDNINAILKYVGNLAWQETCIRWLEPQKQLSAASPASSRPAH